MRADFAANTFTFSSDAVGIYYVQYLAAAGSRMAPGVVRVDVLEGDDSDLPPVAVRDVALLPSGGEVLVNVLVNDSDPGGGILVIQSVSVDPDSGIAVAVLDHETLRISDQGSLGGAGAIDVHDLERHAAAPRARSSSSPCPSPAKLRPPVANDDQVVVRAGDVVTIPVLDNDYHPNGDTMHVAPDLVAAAPRARGRRDLRLAGHRALPRGSRGRHGYATYEVVDSTGQKDAGYITIQVLPVNAETNQAPHPRDIIARVLSGSRSMCAALRPKCLTSPSARWRWRLKTTIRWKPSVISP